MDDLALVEILQGGHNLRQIILGLHFSQSLPALDEFVEGVVIANFQQNVDVLVVLEHMFELDNMSIR